MAGLPSSATVPAMNELNHVTSSTRVSSTSVVMKSEDDIDLDEQVADEFETASPAAQLAQLLLMSSADGVIVPSEIKEVTVKYRWYRTLATRSNSVLLILPFSDVRLFK